VIILYKHSLLNGLIIRKVILLSRSRNPVFIIPGRTEAILTNPGPREEKGAGDHCPAPLIVFLRHMSSRIERRELTVHHLKKQILSLQLSSRSERIGTGNTLEVADLQEVVEQ
jgi:hypothetical protein